MHPSRFDARTTGKPRPLGRRALLLAAILASLIGGCSSVGPDYERPKIDAPPSFTAERSSGLQDTPVDLSEWWTRLGDETLVSLVDRALAKNLSLREALARVQESRALRGVVAPDLYPTVDLSGAVSTNQNSRESFAGVFAPRNNESYSLGASMSWEIDLWGRIARSIEAADAEIALSVEDARSVLVAVIAETATSYVDLRRLQERARIARANIALQEATLELTRDRFKAGLVSELDVAQAASILESTRSALPPLSTGARAARNRLAVLLGVFPGSLEAELSAFVNIPEPQLELGVGIPAQVLERRADVRAAERALAAQSARIGVAEGELYPRISLLGSLGYESLQAEKLLNTKALAFSIGPSISWNVFDRSRLHANVAVADARFDQALRRYERVVLVAVEEVENAMTAFVRDQESREALGRAVEQTRRAVELSRSQYRQGLTSFQSVLDSQRRLFELEDSLAVTRATITADLISLYRALGGGWESRDILLAPREKAAEEQD